jgi:hypothetical protein
MHSAAKTVRDNAQPNATAMTVMMSPLSSLPDSPIYHPPDLDSDSSTSSASPMSIRYRHEMSTYTTVYAEMEAHTSRPPVLTKGDITLLVMNRPGSTFSRNVSVSIQTCLSGTGLS